MSTRSTISCGNGYHVFRDCNNPHFITVADDSGNEATLPEAIGLKMAAAKDLYDIVFLLRHAFVLLDPELKERMDAALNKADGK